MKYKTKCDGCGATVVFDPISQALVCPHCGKMVAVEETAIVSSKKDYKSDSAPVENKTIKEAFECLNCGAQFDMLDSKIVSACPYCASSNVEAVEASLHFQPDAIIPFQIDKARAIGMYKQWIKKRPFAPNNLKKFARMDRLSGKYIPSWLYDADVVTNYNGVGEKRYKDSQGRSHTSSYPFSGSKKSHYDNFYVNADPVKVNEGCYRKLGDFGFDKLRVFNPQYVLGFITSNVTQDLHTSWLSGKNYIGGEIDYKIRSEYERKYDYVSSFSSNHSFSNVKWLLAYLPIWVSKYYYKNKEYNFYVNGATGQVSGKAPKSFWKIFFFVLFILLIVGGIAYLSYLGEK